MPHAHRAEPAHVCFGTGGIQMLKNVATRAVMLTAIAVSLFLACATVPNRSVSETESELQRLESAKWSAESLGNKEAFMALFADDFVSVEYGADTQGGVTRKTRSELFSGAPLPPAAFDLTEWHFVHAGTNTVVVSYRVNALSFPWRAYATSVWTRRGGRWVTVFYQASTAS